MKILCPAGQVEAGACTKSFNLVPGLVVGNASIMGAADNECNIPFKVERGIPQIYELGGFANVGFGGAIMRNVA